MWRSRTRLKSGVLPITNACRLRSLRATSAVDAEIGTLRCTAGSLPLDRPGVLEGQIVGHAAHEGEGRRWSRCGPA